MSTTTIDFESIFIQLINELTHSNMSYENKIKLIDLECNHNKIILQYRKQIEDIIDKNNKESEQIRQSIEEATRSICQSDLSSNQSEKEKPVQNQTDDFADLNKFFQSAKESTIQANQLAQQKAKQLRESPDQGDIDSNKKKFMDIIKELVELENVNANFIALLPEEIEHGNPNASFQGYFDNLCKITELEVLKQVYFDRTRAQIDLANKHCQDSDDSDSSNENSISKAPSKPRSKPLSAYQEFVNKMVPQVRKDYPGLTSKKYMEMVSDMWKDTKSMSNKMPAKKTIASNQSDSESSDSDYNPRPTAHAKKVTKKSVKMPAFKCSSEEETESDSESDSESNSESDIPVRKPASKKTKCPPKKVKAQPKYSSEEDSDDSDDSDDSNDSVPCSKKAARPSLKRAPVKSVRHPMLNKPFDSDEESD